MAAKQEICLTFRIPDLDAAGMGGAQKGDGRVYKWIDWALESAGFVGSEPSELAAGGSPPRPAPLEAPAPAAEKPVEAAEKPAEAAAAPGLFRRMSSKLF